ncbi:MAG: CRISPR-associated helicase Cas3' [Desulfamplus sp.]|nr:CRISPR-associated helicase Cas3' [Desulfamplus sp.]
MQQFYAHSKEKLNKDKWQTIETHLQQVAKLASRFANDFGNGDWAYLAGYLHDLGKYNPAFQSYISQNYDWEESAQTVKNYRKVDHSTAGALLAIEQFKSIGIMLSYLITGHHAGLPDWYPEIGVGGELSTRLGKKELLDKIREYIPEDLPLKLKMPKTAPAVARDAESIHLWIRMLYSSLVDADFLDTENFMNHEKSSLRGNYKELNELKLLLDNYFEELAEDTRKKQTSNTHVNLLRKQVLEECRKAAASTFDNDLKSGIFSLTVPTGGGKTLSSMAFALNHAIKYNKKRVIMAIPFTSIIEQTAEVYKKIFGEEQVIEHHSNFVFEDNSETSKTKLATENWDAPIIVTTNVQLFESLFAARSSGCRKLHNIVNSVVILDEAQTIPVEYLKPILNTLNALVKYFNVTLVLCTATQPALCGKIGSRSNSIKGFEEVKEIISNPLELAVQLKRVEVTFPPNLNESSDWAEIADELKQYEQVLCIVNTRKDCRHLHSLMPEGTIHLSAGMCPEERSDIIQNIRDKLTNGEPIKVISTQLVEAGVDIDFPVVYRALAGLDSIAQAAGRCNREGKMKTLGLVKVFNPPKSAPPGFLRKGQDTTKEIVNVNGYKIPDFSPLTVQNYFEVFYSNCNSFDEKDIFSKLAKDAGQMKIQFRTVARDFKLIDDSSHQSIIVWYENKNKRQKSSNVFELIEQLKNISPERWLLRKLQRFSVSVPKNEFQFYRDQGMIEEIHGLWIQNTHLLYKEGVGVVGQDSDWNSQLLNF